MKQPNPYWFDREQQRLYNECLQVAEKELAKQYRRCANETRVKIEALYNELVASSADGTLLVSDLYKYNRYYDLLNNLNMNLRQLGQKEIELGNKTLTNMYHLNAQFIGDAFGFLPGVNEEYVKTAINAIWCRDGKHWSSRVWSNKAQLEEAVKNGLVDCIASGMGKDELVKNLMGNFSVGFNQANRIARTELNYVQNQATYDSYKQAGITKYKFLAYLDNDTSDVCRDNNNQTYLLSQAEVGVNYPPLHPNCRSTVLAVLE